MAGTGLWSLPAVAGEDAQKCVDFGQGSSLALPVKGALGSCLVPGTLSGGKCPHGRKAQWGSHCILSLCLPQHPHLLVFGGAAHQVSGACAIFKAMSAGARERPQMPCFFLLPLRRGSARGKRVAQSG